MIVQILATSAEIHNNQHTHCALQETHEKHTTADNNVFQFQIS